MAGKPKAELLRAPSPCAICGGAAYAGLRAGRRTVPICGPCVREYLKPEAVAAFEALQIGEGSHVQGRS
jgi:hypothetical protein